MALIIRVIRLSMTLGIGFLIFWTLQYFSGAPTSITPTSFPAFPDLPSYQDAKDKLQQAKSGLTGAFSSKPKDSTIPDDSQTQSTPKHALGPGTGSPDGYVEDAHKLANADDFLNHFKAVTQLPGVSMNTVKAGCNWDSSQNVNFQFLEIEPWAKTDRTDGELDLRRRQWHKFILNDLLPYKDHSSKWEGRGIVIVAGFAKGREQIKVVLRALDKIGSTLPVEVHFWDLELSAADQQEITAISNRVSFNNLKDSSAQNIIKTEYNAFLQNYQLKTAAVINSKFAELLLLDSDNIPVIPPESLFDSGVYKEYGTVFWPDMARTRPNNPIWGITNTVCRKDEYEQESGQLMVNKQKYFYHLQLAAWMLAEKQKEYYNEFLLGDKDTFRFAWHALRTTFGKPKKWLKSVGMLHQDMYCGHSFAQHHPDSWNGSVAFLHVGLTKLMPKDFLVWQRTTNSGLFQAYHASPDEEDPAAVQATGLKLDEMTYWSAKPATIKPLQCNEMSGVSAKQLDEILPNFNAFFDELGGNALLENFFGKQ